MTEIPRRRWQDRWSLSQQMLQHLSRAIQTAIVVMMSYLIYLAVVPQNRLRVDVPIIADPIVVQPGGSITLSLSYHKTKDSISELGVFLASRGRVITLPSSVVALPAGHHRVAVILPIPRHTPPGRYKAYLVRDTLTFFPQHPILVESTEFEVKGERQ